MQGEMWDSGHQPSAEGGPDPGPCPIPASWSCQADAPWEGGEQGSTSSTAWSEPMHSSSVPNPSPDPSSGASSPEAPVPHSQAPFPRQQPRCGTGGAVWSQSRAEVRHHKAGFSRFHLMSCAYISIHLLMSMVRMCVMPGLEKSTPRLTVGA